MLSTFMNKEQQYLKKYDKIQKKIYEEGKYNS